MQPPATILVGLLLTAAAQAPAPAEPSPVDAALARYDELPPAARERWIREMSVRLDRANAVVLNRDEAARQRGRTEKFLRLVADGYRPPRSSLENLLTELRKREPQATERLARGYRIQIYRTFRQQDAVFRARKEAWDRVEAAWRTAGSPLEPQHQLIDWLVVATYRSTPGTIGTLPGVPDFGRQIGLPRRLAGVDRSSEPGLPRTVTRPELPPRRSPAPLPEIDQGRAPAPQATLPGDWLLPAPTQPEAPAAELAALQTARPGGRSRVPRSRPARRVPRVGPRALDAAAGPAGPPSEAPSPAAKDLVRRPAPTPPIAVDQRAAPKEDSIFSDWLLPPSRDPAEQTGGYLMGDQAAEGGGLLARGDVGAPSAAGRSQSVGGTPAGSAHAPDRWPAFPVEPPPAPPAASDTAPAGPSRPAPARDAGPAEPRVRVNLKELSAGIAGANLALRALEAELDNDLPSSARDLASLVDRLEVLVLRHDDLALFCELITPEERRRAGPLESPRALIPRLANKIFELRSRATGQEFTGTEPERELELKILADLSRQLAEMADER